MRRQRSFFTVLEENSVRSRAGFFFKIFIQCSIFKLIKVYLKINI